MTSGELDLLTQCCNLFRKGGHNVLGKKDSGRLGNPLQKEQQLSQILKCQWGFTINEKESPSQQRGHGKNYGMQKGRNNECFMGLRYRGE